MKAYKLLIPVLFFILSLIALPSLVQAAIAKKKGGKGAFTGGAFSMGNQLS